MGWDSSGNHLKLVAPISLADITYATGETSQNLGYMIANGSSINPMAKYKPVKHTNPGVLSNSERAYARYGFAATPPTLNMTQSAPQNDWVYDKPTAGQPNEWFRALDFDGYVSNACAPLVLSFGQIVNDGESQIIIYANEKGNGIRTDGKSWVANESLSIGELLESRSDYYHSYVAFILINGSTKNLVVTGTTFATLVGGSAAGIGLFKLFASATTESGVYYPGVPVLANSSSGDTITVIACVMATGYPSTGTAYNVYTTDLSLYIPYSLGFVSGCDRFSAPVTTSAFSLDGVNFSVSVALTNMVTETYYSGYYWRAYMVSVSGTFDTTGASGWSPSTLQQTLSGTLTLSNSASFPFGSSPGSGDTSFSVGASVGLYPSSSGQVRSIYSAGSDRYLWVMLNGAGGSPITSDTITATVVMDTPLTSSLTKYGYGSV